MDKETGGSAFATELQFDHTGKAANSHAKITGGLTVRDYFAIHGPEPLDSDVAFQRQIDKNNNPYNESHKPRLRSDSEIRSFLRYKFADSMIEARQ